MDVRKIKRRARSGFEKGGKWTERFWSQDGIALTLRNLVLTAQLSCQNGSRAGDAPSRHLRGISNPPAVSASEVLCWQEFTAAARDAPQRTQKREGGAHLLVHTFFSRFQTGGAGRSERGERPNHRPNMDQMRIASVFNPCLSDAPSDICVLCVLSWLIAHRTSPLIAGRPEKTNVHKGYSCLGSDSVLSHSCLSKPLFSRRKWPIRKQKNTLSVRATERAIFGSFPQFALAGCRAVCYTPARLFSQFRANMLLMRSARRRVRGS